MSHLKKKEDTPSKTNLVNKDIPTESLTGKYAMLNRIGVENWAPTNHRSSITSTLAKLIFQIGTKSKINFGESVFEHTMRHDESFTINLPIDFPCLISRIILK